MINYKTVLKEFYTMVRYSLVGIINTAVFLSSVFLLRLTGISYPVYTGLGYAIAIGVSFVLNLTFTFSSLPGKTAVRVFKFLAVALFLLLLAEALQVCLIEIAGVPELAGVLSGMILYTATGYVLNRFIVFN